MPVKIGNFRPTSMERVEELRRSKVRRGDDPGMAELLDNVESGVPQEVPVAGDQRPKGMRIAIARAAKRRGLAVEMFEANDEQGGPVVVVVKSAPAVKPPQVQPSGNGRRRGRPRKQEHGSWTDTKSGGISGEPYGDGDSVEES